MPAIKQDGDQERVPSPSSQLSANTLPIRKHAFPLPKLRLQLHDLSHEGSSIFLSNFKGNEDFSLQVQNVLNLLYLPASTRPETRSVTLILRDLGDGVAYTTGTDLDSDHKEIHLNLNYITRPASPRDEILGVLCHELVHCFQWNSEGTAPGGLIEGIADWVRLRADLAASHWKQEAGGKWDAGYQHTGFFLDWLEKKFGDGTVRGINEGLRQGKYDEKKVFGKVCGEKEVGELWKEYGEDLRKSREERTSPNDRLRRDDES